jgi:hypothetical protein
MFQLTKLYCSNFGGYIPPEPVSDGDAVSGCPDLYDDLATTIEGYNPLELRNKVSRRALLAEHGECWCKQGAKACAAAVMHIAGSAADTACLLLHASIKCLATTKNSVVATF